MPDYFEAPRILALHYFSQDVEPEACRRLLSRTLELAPDDLYSLSLLGGLHIRNGRFDLARDPLERAFALAPKCETCSNVGLVLFHEAKYHEAANFYELALDYCGEDDLDTWANWAKSLYWAEGGREDSLAKFEVAITLSWEAWAAGLGTLEPWAT